jgi:hypothetical protein
VLINIQTLNQLAGKENLLFAGKKFFTAQLSELNTCIKQKNKKIA